MRLQTLALSAAVFLLLAPAAASATDIQAVGQPCSPNGLTAGPNLSGQSVICTAGAWVLTGGEWGVNGTSYYYSGGNVGIGSTSPAATLDVNGTAAVNSHKLYLANGGNVTHWIQFNSGTTEVWNYWNNLDFQSYNSGTNTHTLWLGSTGNVGIGTTAPGYPLQINGQAAWGAGTQLGRLNYSTTEVYVENATSGGILAFRTNAGSGDADVVDILSNGNVGIGTTSPQATLDVKGYARLALQSSQPAACSTTNQGAIALNHLAQMCACNGTSWIFADSVGASCSW